MSVQGVGGRPKVPQDQRKFKQENKKNLGQRHLVSIPGCRGIDTNQTGRRTEPAGIDTQILGIDTNQLRTDFQFKAKLINL